MFKTISKLSVTAVGVLLAGASSGCLTRDVSAAEPSINESIQQNVAQQAVDKIDLLLAIDNSSSMADKQAFLARAVPQLVSRLVTPNCVSEDGTVTGLATVNERGEGVCADGKAEFKPITDIHVGVISSSLGLLGGVNVRGCGDEPPGNDHANLLMRGAESVSAEPGNFLAWFPTGAVANENKPRPSHPYESVDSLKEAFKTVVLGVGENGCGFEAQLESVYQFLNAPQPWAKIALDDKRDGESWNRARYDGVNTTVLQQRSDFLRPDSLVAVIMLTDEDDSSVDPLSFEGSGHAFASTGNMLAGTAACATDPLSPECRSCAQGGANCSDEQKQLPARDADANVRFYAMKRRFGVDPQYTLQRYIDGFSSTKLSHRDEEWHDDNPDTREDDRDRAPKSCVNPLFFGGKLPTDGSVGDVNAGDLGSLCQPEGPSATRDPGLVFFAVVGGVPNELLQADARDDSGALTPAAWDKIVGKDPKRYDYSGQDPRMVVATTPRNDRPGVGSADAEANDPLNKTHRDWDTSSTEGGALRDLQYACTFPLPEDMYRAAPAKPEDPSDCHATSDSPLCEGPRGTARRQIRGKAYPTLRQATVVRHLGAQGIMASLCPQIPTGTESDPAYGYNPVVNEIVDRLKNALTARCLPRSLARDAQGAVPCLMLEVMPAEITECNPADGRSKPDADIERRFREANLKGDEKSRTVCVLSQNTSAQSVDECQAGTGEASGWCYLEGDAAGRCEQQIVFNDAALSKARGSVVFLQCINDGSSQASTEAPAAE